MRQTVLKNRELRLSNRLPSVFAWILLLFRHSQCLRRVKPRRSGWCVKSGIQRHRHCQPWNKCDLIFRVYKQEQASFEIFFSLIKAIVLISRILPNCERFICVIMFCNVLPRIVNIVSPVWLHPPCLDRCRASTLDPVIRPSVSGPHKQFSMIMGIAEACYQGYGVFMNQTLDI